jgi:hypothetical protein
MRELLYALLFARRARANRFLPSATLYVCFGRELVGDGASNYFLMSRSVGGNLFWVSSLIFRRCAFNGIGLLPVNFLISI